MDLRRRLEKEIEKQTAGIAELRHKLTVAEAYMDAQTDMLKLLPRTTENGKAATLRPGSDPAKVRDFIREAGTPLHVSDLLSKLGRPLTRESRSALSGTLGWYVNKGTIFTRPAPNTFALVDMPQAQPDDDNVMEPPDDFGSDTAD